MIYLGITGLGAGHRPFELAGQGSDRTLRRAILGERGTTRLPVLHRPH
jgi:hypothetical protein